MNTNEEDEILSALPQNGKENPFKVPENYFDSLTSSIEAAVFTESLKEKISLDGFTVPANYFDLLGSRISARIPSGSMQTKPSKVRRLTFFKFKYAAAACLLLAASSIFYLNRQSQSSQIDMHSVPEEEIANYLKTNTEVDDSEVLIKHINMDQSFTSFEKGFSNDELEQYINSTSL